VRIARCAKRVVHAHADHLVAWPHQPRRTAGLRYKGGIRPATVVRGAIAAPHRHVSPVVVKTRPLGVGAGPVRADADVLVDGCVAVRPGREELLVLNSRSVRSQALDVDIVIAARFNFVLESSLAQSPVALALRHQRGHIDQLKLANLVQARVPVVRRRHDCAANRKQNRTGDGGDT